MRSMQRAAAVLQPAVTRRADACIDEGMGRYAACMLRGFVPPSFQPGTLGGSPRGQLGGFVQDNYSVGDNVRVQRDLFATANLDVDQSALLKDTWDWQKGYQWRSFRAASICGRSSGREATGTWVLDNTLPGWRGFAAASSGIGGGSRGPSPAKLRAVPFTVTRSEAVAEYEAHHSAHWMFKRPSNGDYHPY